MLAALWAFLTALPDLIAIYKSIGVIVGKEERAAFLSDLDQSTKLVVDSQDITLPVDVRRKMRQDALERSRAIWGRIS